MQSQKKILLTGFQMALEGGFASTWHSTRRSLSSLTVYVFCGTVTWGASDKQIWNENYRNDKNK